MTDGHPTVCVVAPVYNERDGIAEFVRRVLAVLGDLPRPEDHTLLLVDDGSTDGTHDALMDLLAAGDERIEVLRLSRNFGHQAAVTAGLDHSSGDVVVVMDSDLQDDPGAIPKLVERHLEGYDVVFAVRTRRKEPFMLRLAYRLHYRLVALISRPSLPGDAGDFSLMSRRVVDLLAALPERQRYVRGLRAWAGFRQTGIEVERGPRYSGSSSYTLSRLVGLAFDGIFAFSVVPIRLALTIGGLVMGLSVLYSAYALVIRLLSGSVPAGFTALLVVMVFLNGAVLTFVGIIGEYVGRIYEEVKGRPTYVVESLSSAQRGTDG